MVTLRYSTGLSHGYIYHPNPHPTSKTAKWKQNRFLHFRVKLIPFYSPPPPPPRKHWNLTQNFLNLASYFPPQSSFCERLTKLLDHKSTLSFALVTFYDLHFLGWWKVILYGHNVKHYIQVYKKDWRPDILQKFKKPCRPNIQDAGGGGGVE